MDTANAHTLSEDIVAEARKRVCDRVDELAEKLVATSHAIHAEPELNFEEHIAHDLLTGVLAEEGLPVVRGAYGLDTAFEADVGTEGPVLAVLCEYDALPGIGHALWPQRDRYGGLGRRPGGCHGGYRTERPGPYFGNACRGGWRWEGHHGQPRCL